jgi:hypothetical protein
MAYDAARAVTVLFSGSGGGQAGDTWKWNGTAWAEPAVTGPSARIGHSMAYDTTRAVTVLFGGVDYFTTIALGDTWEWNGTAWTQRLVSGPSPRAFAAMVYDAARAATVLFGGTDTLDNLNGETWVLGAPCPADFDHSGAVNSQDFFDFLTAFFALDPAADFNHSGTVDSQDYADFLTAFFAGCS